LPQSSGTEDTTFESQVAVQSIRRSAIWDVVPETIWTSWAAIISPHTLIVISLNFAPHRAILYKDT
jgi:hypothetical protein